MDLPPRGEAAAFAYSCIGVSDLGVRGLGFRVWDLGFRVPSRAGSHHGLLSGSVWGLGFWISGGYEMFWYIIRNHLTRVLGYIVVQPKSGYCESFRPL